MKKYLNKDVTKMEKIKDFEIKYYKKGIGLHDPKSQVIEGTTKQEAYDEFKRLFPNTCTLGIKRVKVIDYSEIDSGEDKALSDMEKGICEAEKAHIE